LGHGIQSLGSGGRCEAQRAGQLVQLANKSHTSSLPR
jgi:hypothetical protein